MTNEKIIELVKYLYKRRFDFTDEGSLEVIELEQILVDYFNL